MDNNNIGGMNPQQFSQNTPQTSQPHMGVSGIELQKMQQEAEQRRREQSRRNADFFGRLDTGTMDSLVEAADFVRMIEKRQGIKISAPEEIAFKYGWIDRDTLLESAERYGKSPYGQHLKNVADGKLRY